MAVLCALSLGACGGDKVVHDLPEAKDYIRDLVRGAHPGDFKLAKDATPQARLVFRKAAETASLAKKAKEFPDWGCEVLDLTEKLPNLSGPVVFPDDRQRLKLDAAAAVDLPTQTFDLVYGDDFDVLLSRASDLNKSDLATAYRIGCAAKGF